MKPSAGDDPVRTRFRVLLTASLVSSLIMLDSNIVAVSLPAIARSLGSSFADIDGGQRLHPQLRRIAAGCGVLCRSARPQASHADRPGHLRRRLGRLRPRWVATGAPYAAFAADMVVAGSGAGLLNGETARVMQGAVTAQRAGSASGLAGTTRFVGLLLGVAGLGAMLGHVATARFLAGAPDAGLDPALAAPVARRVMSGDIAGALRDLSPALQMPVGALGKPAFADGFAAASVLAADIAALAGLLAFLLLRATATATAATVPDATHVVAIE